MRKFLTLFISSYVLLLNASYAQQNLVYPAEVLSLPLDSIQFKGTHNSYQRGHVPQRQIDQYNIWEIELDFGALSPSELVVGHDGPEGKFNLWYLRDWVNNVKAANSLQYHPIILKLEAKTQDSCGDFTCIGCCWKWPDVKDWGNWQKTLTDELIAAIGPENWITRDKFKSKDSARELAGKFIISLQDNNDGKDIQNPNSTDFFFPQFEGKDIPLTAWSPKSGDWRPIESAADFGYALKQSANRLIMDEGYKEPWSNVLVHSPLPSWVYSLSTQTTWQWGTILEPFQTIGHAVNASWTRSGAPTHQVINIFAGTYDDKVTISTPAELYGRNGTVTIGGKNVAYTITLSVMDVPEAGTNSPVYMHLRGADGSTGDYLLENTETYFDRAGAETFWITAADVGVLQSITIGVQGSDDVYIDDIIVVSATTGWKKVHAGAWIGDDNGSPKTFNF